MSVRADQLWPKYFPNAKAPDDKIAKIGQLSEKLSDNHVAPAEFYPQVKALIPRLEAWVTDHDLLTLDASRPLEVRVTPPYQRSEEHTSELQSLMRISYAVFCLKKKTYKHTH